MKSNQKQKKKIWRKTFTFCFCFTCCVRIVFRIANGGPVNLLTAGTVCNRMVFPDCVKPGVPC